MPTNPSAQSARTLFRKQLLPFVTKAPVRLWCGQCKEEVPAAMAWTCGECNRVNSRTAIYSFLNECQSCGKQPTSFECPSCELINSFRLGDDETKPARNYVALPKPVPPVDPKVMSNTEHEERKAHIVRETEIARLTASLRIAKAVGEARTNTEEQALAVKELVACAKKILLFEVAVPEAKKILMEIFKDYPDYEKRIDEVITLVVEEQDRAR